MLCCIRAGLIDPEGHLLTGMHVEQRLAAVLTANVAGYGGLMGREVGLAE